MSQGQVDDRWIIEDAGEAIGMIVRDEAGYVFHAAVADVWSLDRHVFANVHSARQTVLDLLRARRRPPPGKAVRR